MSPKQEAHMKDGLLKWQQEHILEGLRQADAGEFASEEEVRRAVERLKERDSS